MIGKRTGSHIVGSALPAKLISMAMVTVESSLEDHMGSAKGQSRNAEFSLPPQLAQMIGVSGATARVMRC